MGKIIGNTECPGCKKSGRDKTGNHLILFEDGGAYCNRCGYKEEVKTFTKPNTDNIRGTKTPEEIQADLKWVEENSVITSLKDRHIKQFVCEHYGVRTGLSCTDGVTPVITYLPIKDEDNKLIGYKCKTPDKRMWIKGKGKDAHFFGADVCPPKGNKIFITEGQEDAMALYQIIYEKVDQKYRKRTAVVSLQNGAGSATAEFVRNSELLRGYKEIVLCFDMDEAGKEAVDAVLTVLPRSKVKVAKYEEKDANDMLKVGKAQEMYFNVIQANDPKPEKIVSGTEFSLESLKTPLRAGIATPFTGLNDKMHGLRYGPKAGELSIIAAAPGFGKTTLARELNHCILSTTELAVGNIFLEEDKAKTAQGLIAIDNDIPLPVLRQNPGAISNEAYHNSFNKLINNDKYYALNHWGSLDSGDLMEHMWYFSKVLGCSFIFLDHISLVISGQQSSSEGERKDIDKLMTNLASFTEESGTSVISVVHLSRPDRGSFNEGRQVSLRDLRGSSAIEGLAHNIIAIEGNQQGDNPNARTLRILKSREWGELGECDNLMYHPDTGRLIMDNVNYQSGMRDAG